MEGEVTEYQFFKLLAIHNSAKTSFTRIDFCETMNMSSTNGHYRSILEMMINYMIAEKRPMLHDPKGYYIIINKKNLADFLLETKYYKSVQDFIHKVSLVAVTP